MAASRRLTPARLTLVGLTLVAAALRLYRLGAESLWLDEGYTQTWTSQPVGAMLATLAQGDYHPPLYYLLVRGVTLVLGPGASSLRLVSAVAGILAVPALYALARTLAPSSSRRAALLAAALLTFSPFQLYYSQEARSYSLLLLLGIASTWTYWRLGPGHATRPTDLAGATRPTDLAVATHPDPTRAAWETRHPSRAMLAHAATTTLLLYTHVAGLFVVLAHLVHLAWIRPSSWRRVLQATGLAGVAFLPWASVVVSQFQRLQAGFWIPAPTLWPHGSPDYSLVGTLLEYTGGPGPLAIAAAFTLAALALPWAKRRAERLARRRDPAAHGPASTTSATLLLVILASTCILVPLVASWFVQPFYLARITIVAWAPLAILAARGTDTIAALLPSSKPSTAAKPCAPKRRAAATALGIVAVIVVALPALGHYYEPFHKEMWHDTVALIDAQAGPNATIILSGNGLAPLFAQAPVRADLNVVAVTGTGPGSVGAVRAAAANATEVWFVFAHTGNVHPQVDAIQANRSNLPMLGEFTPHGDALPAAKNPIKIVRWSPAAPTPA